MRTRTPVITALAVAALALTACSTTASTTHPASVAPVSTLSYADAGRVCAALNALEFSGSSKAAAATTAEGAYHYPAADIARARKIRCPRS
jgi:hypothetical protein